MGAFLGGGAGVAPLSPNGAAMPEGLPRAWLAPGPVTLPPELRDLTEIPLPLRRVLYRRGYRTAGEQRALWEGAGYPLPGPEEFPALEQAAHLVAQEVAAGHTLAVHGDYDADGVTATALLVRVLQGLGTGVVWRVPRRFRHGYGVAGELLAELKDAGARLVITCDCGVSSHRELADAGLPVVVTDHHAWDGEAPPAAALVHPALLPAEHPYRPLCGVGVAYLLARRVAALLGRPEAAEAQLDLVALGTVADVVQVGGANRDLLRRGLEALRRAEKPGVAALLRAARVARNHCDEEDLAFQLVPRLNAAGRLGDAATAVELLLAAEAGPAERLAQELERLNAERRRLSDATWREAREEAAALPGPVALFRPHWHEGVVGIVAGRLARERGAPAALVARREDGLLTGSARAPEGQDLLPLLARCAPHLERSGGHPGAAGFTLRREEWEAFRTAFRAAALDLSPAAGAAPPRADARLPLGAVDEEFHAALRRLGPYGQGHPAPVFWSTARVAAWRPVGRTGEHLSLVLEDAEASLPAMWWRAGQVRLSRDLPVQVAFRLRPGNGEGGVQLVVEGLGSAEGEESPAPRPAPTLVDCRGARDAAAKFPAAAWFREGPAAQSGQDRYTLRRATRLVLGSFPPSPRVLAEAVALAEPAELVLVGEAERGERAFWQDLLGALKRVTREGRGRASLQRLAVLTGELEATVLGGLEVLEASGLITCEYDGEDRVWVERRRERGALAADPARERVRALLAESRAFRRFLAGAPLPAVSRLLTGEEADRGNAAGTNPPNG